MKKAFTFIEVIFSIIIIGIVMVPTVNGFYTSALGIQHSYENNQQRLTCKSTLTILKNTVENLNYFDNIDNVDKLPITPNTTLNHEKYNYLFTISKPDGSILYNVSTNSSLNNYVTSTNLDLYDFDNVILYDGNFNIKKGVDVTVDNTNNLTTLNITNTNSLFIKNLTNTIPNLIINGHHSTTLFTYGDFNFLSIGKNILINPIQQIKNKYLVTYSVYSKNLKLLSTTENIIWLTLN